MCIVQYCQRPFVVRCVCLIVFHALSMMLWTVGIIWYSSYGPRGTDCAWVYKQPSLNRHSLDTNVGCNYTLREYCLNPLVNDTFVSVQFNEWTIKWVLSIACWYNVSCGWIFTFCGTNFEVMETHEACSKHPPKKLKCKTTWMHPKHAMWPDVSIATYSG